MSINDNGTRDQYTATASQTVFTYTFEIFNKVDITVQQNTVTLLEGTHYTVSNVGNNSGGNVTLVTGATSGDIITLYRDMALERLSNYQQNGDFLADEINTDLVRLWAGIQQTSEMNNKSIRTSFSDTVLNSSNTMLADVATRAGKTLGFASDGTLDYKSFGSVSGGGFFTSSTTSTMTGLSGLNTGDVIQTAEFSTGNGGGGTYDAVLTSSVTPNTFNVIISIADPLISFVLRVGGEINAEQLVSLIQDSSTDQTSQIAEAITICHNLGIGNLGTNWTGLNLRIPSHTKWNYNTLTQFYNGSVASTSSASVATLNGSPSFVVNELVGAFLWNKTDFSYGVIVSNTEDTVTVSTLRIGDTNNFAISDNVVISKHKVGVNIVDDSRYDPHNDKFTGQRRIYSNSDAPSTTAANEQHIAGQYHPAYIVSNINDSNMEKRASFIVRNYDPVNDRISTFLQMGINPLNNTADVNDVDVLFTGGHNDGSGLYTKQFMGFRTEDSNSVNIGFGIRADSNYFCKFQNNRNAVSKYNFDAQGTQHTDWEFSNSNVKHDVWRILSTGGSTGFRRAITNTVGNLSVTLQRDSTRIYTNAGAVGGRTITLPNSNGADIIGMEITLAVTDNQTFAVDPLSASGDQILGTTAAEANVTSSTIGDTITLTCISVGFWSATSINGTWSFN